MTKREFKNKEDAEVFATSKLSFVEFEINCFNELVYIVYYK